MDSPTARQPYHPPRITRVMLNSEQAVLSQCSVTASVAEQNQSLNCVAGGCKGIPEVGDGDFAGRTS